MIIIVGIGGFILLRPQDATSEVVPVSPTEDVLPALDQNSSKIPVADSHAVTHEQPVLSEKAPSAPAPPVNTTVGPPTGSTSSNALGSPFHNAPHSTGPVESATEDQPDTSSPLATPARFKRAINGVRAGLVERDLARAERHLNFAARISRTPGQQDQVRQFRELAAQLAKFWQAVRAGLKKIEPTDELTFGETIAAVFESGPDHLALFIEGSRRDYTISDMPANVALMIMTYGVDEHAPESNVFVGAFHVVDPAGDPAEARRLWQSASNAGQSVNELLPFLDKSTLVIEREAVPDQEQLAEAQTAIEEKFADGIRAAKSPAWKLELASKLFTAAGQAEASVDHYALLKQACRWSVSATAPRPVLRSIDELARWFDVDALALKSEAFEHMSDASLTAPAAKQLAVRALELADQAEAEDRILEAQSFAATAQTAARKARDRELIKKTTLRRREIDKKSPPKHSNGGFHRRAILARFESKTASK